MSLIELTQFVHFALPFFCSPLNWILSCLFNAVIKHLLFLSSFSFFPPFFFSPHFLKYSDYMILDYWVLLVLIKYAGEILEIVLPSCRSDFPQLANQGNSGRIIPGKGTLGGAVTRQKSKGSRTSESSSPALSQTSLKGKKGSVSKQSGKPFFTWPSHSLIKSDLSSLLLQKLWISEIGVKASV